MTSPINFTISPKFSRGRVSVRDLVAMPRVPRRFDAMDVFAVALFALAGALAMVAIIGVPVFP